MTNFQEINTIRKSGRVEEAYQKAKSALQENPTDNWIKRALAWVYYEMISNALKELDYNKLVSILAEVNSLSLPADELMFYDKLCWKLGSALNKLDFRDQEDLQYLIEIKNFCLATNLESSEGGYNFLLKMLHKTFKETEYYKEIINWWNLDYLTSEDFEESKTATSKSIPSNGEQIYIALAKHILATVSSEVESHFNKDAASKLEKKLKELTIKFPQNRYLAYYRAKLLFAIGDKENGLKCFLPVAQRKRNEFWIWALLSDLLDNSQDDQMACLSRALQCSSPPEMLLKVREKLAEILIEKKLFNEASIEVHTIKETRLEHNFKISQKIHDWSNSDWYISANKLKNNQSFYARHAGRAEDLIYMEKPAIQVLISRLNEAKKIAYYIDSERNSGFFKYDRYLNNPKQGDIVQIRIKEIKEDKYTIIYSAIEIENQLLNESLKKSFNGLIKIKEGQSFGFVDDILVSAELISNKHLQSNQIVYGTCVLSFNKKKDTWGWIALEIFTK